MRSSWVFVVAVVAGSASCGGSAPSPAAPAWTAPPLLTQVPAESPYVFASIAPLSEAVRARAFLSVEVELGQLVDRAQHMSADQIIARVKAPDRAALAPWIRAGVAVAHELNAKDMANLPSQLGLAASGRFVLYGLSLWPVLRLEVANPVRLRQLIERALAASGVPTQQATQGGRAYWSAATPEITLIASVLAHDVVFAVVPTAAVAGVLPQLLGSQPPAQPLIATTAVPDLLARHHLIGFSFGYVDVHRVIDIVAGRGPIALDAPVHALTGTVPPACAADLDRLAGLAPRLVFGYHRIDEAGFDGGLVVESPSRVAGALVRLGAAAPEVTAALGPAALFAVGAAFNFDETVALLRGVTGELHAHPFSCPWLAGLDRQGELLATKLAFPFPPLLRNLHGASLVIDSAEILPPSIEGHLLIASNHAADLVPMATALVPALAGLKLKDDGVAVELPLQKLGVPLLSSTHVAMSGDRLAIATGTASDRRATAELAVVTPPSSPLFTIAFDGKQLRALLAALGAETETESLTSLGQAKFSLDATGAGLRFNVVGTWGEPPAPAPAPAPRPVTAAAP